MDSQGEAPAAVTSTSTASSDKRGSGGSGTGRSHFEEGFTTKEDSVPTSSESFDRRGEKEDEDEDEDEEEGGVALGREAHRPRRCFSRRGKTDDSMSSRSSGSGGDGGGGGKCGNTTVAPCFVTHGDGARGITTATSSAVNGVRGAGKRVGGRVGGGNAVVVGGDGGGGLYDDDDSDCFSYGSTLTLGRPEPSSVHWKYSRRLLQT